MVSAKIIESNISTVDSFTKLTEKELCWCTVTLDDVFKRGKRLEASVFGIEGKRAREVLKQCKWPIITITGEDGFADAFHRPRFKRIWVEKSDLPIFQPSQVGEIKPRPSGYLSSLTNTDIELLRVSPGQILLTCSGTLGNCCYVSKTLADKIFSHDLIRITCKDENDAGFVYAFIRTKIGNALIRTNEYGAVISHIEPEHLKSVLIPNPPKTLKRRIHNLIFKSYVLRDESNDLLDQAEIMLYDAFNLPPIEKFTPHYFDKNSRLRNYTTHLSDLAGRLDASYHITLINDILCQFGKEAKEITTIGNQKISKKVILPGRFARVYVEEDEGTIFIGGKQIYELDPSNKKYLSFLHHGERIKKELTLDKNMLMITCSGTIGKVVLVPEHWKGWTANQHIIRVEPASSDIAGYLYVFLNTDYGRELINRFIYGAVVDEIDDRHVSQVPIPLLKDPEIQAEINQLALEANNKRTEAYNIEQEAIRIINEEVIYATSWEDS